MKFADNTTLEDAVLFADCQPFYSHLSSTKKFNIRFHGRQTLYTIYLEFDVNSRY